LLKGFLTLRPEKHEGQIARDAIELAKIRRQLSDIPMAKFQPGEIRSLYRAGSKQLSVIHIDSDDPATWPNPMGEMKGGNPIPTRHIQYAGAIIEIQVGQETLGKRPRPGILLGQFTQPWRRRPQKG
jgi:hypothetical protein